MGLRLMNATPLETGLSCTTSTPKSRLRKPSADITIGASSRTSMPAWPAASPQARQSCSKLAPNSGNSIHALDFSQKNLTRSRTRAYVDDCVLLWYYSCARVGSPFYDCWRNSIIPQEDLLLLLICYPCIVPKQKCSLKIIFHVNISCFLLRSIVQYDCSLCEQDEVTFHECSCRTTALNSYWRLLWIRSTS